MKCSEFLATICCVLSIHATWATSYHKVENAHSEIMSYVQESMGGVRMMRGNGHHLECYNGFLPLINSLAIKAKDVSYGCVSIANFEKDQELLELKNARLIVAAEVTKITKSLTDCSNMDGLSYFECLEANAETNRQIMETVKEKSKELMSKYSATSLDIDSKEQACIMKAVSNGKAESDQAFADLKTCIVNGPIIQTQIGEVEDVNNQTGNEQ